MRKIFVVLLLFVGMHSWANPAMDQINTLIEKKSAQHAPKVKPRVEHFSNTAHFNFFLSKAAISLRKHFTFVLFYMSTCPHCQRFDPILRSLIDRYHFNVQAYTLNGASLPSFPNSIQPSLQISESFFGDKGAKVPALFLVNNKNLNAYTVSIGEASRAGLVSRLNELAPKIIAFEKGGRIDV